MIAPIRRALAILAIPIAFSASALAHPALSILAIPASVPTIQTPTHTPTLTVTAGPTLTSSPTLVPTPSYTPTRTYTAVPTPSRTPTRTNTALPGTPTPTPPLAITSIAPKSGHASKGVLVWIYGTGFIPGASLTIGGVMAENVQVVLSTEMSATTPALTPGTLNPVTVTQGESATL